MVHTSRRNAQFWTDQHHNAHQFECKAGSTFKWGSIPRSLYIESGVTGDELRLFLVLKDCWPKISIGGKTLREKTGLSDERIAKAKMGLFKQNVIDFWQGSNMAGTVTKYVLEHPDNYQLRPIRKKQEPILPTIKTGDQFEL